MIMKKINIILALILLAGLLLTACQPAGDSQQDNDDAYGPDAVVEYLEILLLESFPVQAVALVSGYLPEGCTELVEINAEQRGMKFILTLVTSMPTGDVACTLALEPFEETIPLEINGLKAGTYTVIAKDQQAEFRLDVDNIVENYPIEPVFGSQDPIFTSDAVVETLSVMIMESYPVQVNVNLSGYLPDGCTTIKEVRSSRDGNTFTIGIVTRRPGGDVSCTMAIVPFEETVSLEVDGLPAGEYSVRVGELSAMFTLEIDN
ncbi:MAG: hypothetical protein WCY93_11460 [Anaerolineaceae bacterium]